MIEYSTTVRVRYSETDKMSIAHHANYLLWMELGRTEMLRDAGLSYKKMEDMGYSLPVCEVTCRYIKPALYDDIIEITVSIEELKKRTIKMRCEIYRENDKTLLAGGSTIHPCIHIKSGKISTFPEEILVILNKSIEK